MQPYSFSARLLGLTLLVGALPACGWLSGAMDPEAVEAVPVEGVEVADPNKPTCRPAELDARGEFPWKVGDATPGGWAVTAIDSSHVEFLRVTFEKEGTSTSVELAYNDKGASDWATERYRLMPAPDATPPQELLAEAMVHLKAFAAAESGPAFVRRSEGTQDPYEGLPPCP